MDPVTLLISGIYYIIVGILTFFSVFGVYVLIRYGKSRAVSLSASILYALFFLTLLSTSYATLQNIR